MSKSGLCFGIDLGTTNSAIAVMRGKGSFSASIVELEDGARTLPSCVMYSNGEVIVGRKAYENRWDLDKVVYSVKRLMGEDTEIRINDGKSEFTVTPVQVSAEILKELKRQAERVYGEGVVSEAVVTVPAYFNVNQRNATQEAARLAGIKLLAIINEPTAAALAYGLNYSKSNERVLVYDLGGGTFDVTLLDIIAKSGLNLPLLNIKAEDDSDSGCVVQIAANSGDTRLGGDDLDVGTWRIIATRFENSCKHKYGFGDDFSVDKIMSHKDIEKIILTIESQKKFAIKDTTVFSVDFKWFGKDYSESIILQPEDFARAFEPIFAKTTACIRDCLIHTTDKTFSKIILNGGSTKLEILRSKLRSVYPDIQIYDGLNPDESVALGAAVRASIEKGNHAVTIFDVIPLPIGIGVTEVIGDVHIDGRFKQVIKRDMPLPATATCTITTNVDNQTGIFCPVYQGTHSMEADNVYLGSVAIEDLPAKKAGEVSIQVRMNVDVNGILGVEVKYKDHIVSTKLSNILKSENKKQTKFDILMKRYKRLLLGSGLSPEELTPWLHMLDECMISKKDNPELRKYVKSIGEAEIARISGGKTQAFESINASYKDVAANSDAQDEDSEEN